MCMALQACMALTVLRREKVQIRDIKICTAEAVLCLQQCYDCADWNMFIQSSDDDLNHFTDDVCISYFL